MMRQLRKQYDVIIVGSGAGGAPIAHTIASLRSDSAILVLEKGPLLREQQTNRKSDFSRDEMLAVGSERKITIDGVTNRGSSLYSSHIEPDINEEPHVYVNHFGQEKATIEGYTAQCIGGGTQLYGGVSLRYSPTDFQLRSFNEGRDVLNRDTLDHIFDWPISYQDLEPYYEQAEHLIGINGTAEFQEKPEAQFNYQKPLDPHPISNVVKQGFDSLGLRGYRTPLAVITEDHQPSSRRVSTKDVVNTGFVNRYGDPMGFKSNTWVSLLKPIADKENVDILTNSSAFQINQKNGVVTGLKIYDGLGEIRDLELAPNGVLVVACSAIESNRLLMLSAGEDQEFSQRINRNQLLGRYFQTHAFGGAETRLNRRFDKSKSLDSDWACDIGHTQKFLEENRLWAGGTIYNNTSDQAMPLSLLRNHWGKDLDSVWQGFEEDSSLWGKRLNQFFDQDFGTRLSISFMANQIPQSQNRIYLHSRIRDKWNLPVAVFRKEWHEADRRVMNTFAELCSNILERGIEELDYKGEVQSGGVYQGDEGNRLANHLLGGAIFGDDPEVSVLDPNCRAWNFDNLYVTDGSFMPTSGGGNPTLTIQANSFRVADHIVKRL